MRRRLSSSSGFSLVSALIAAALVSLLALAFSQIILNSVRGANFVKFRTDGDTLNEEIRALLSSVTACTNSFGGLVGAAGASYDVAQLKNDIGTGGAVVYTAGTAVGDGSVNWQTAKLENFRAGAYPNKGQMTLKSRFYSPKEVAGPNSLKAREIEISLELDASKKIISCIALAKMSDGIWQRTASNLNDIMFAPQASGGNVGIGRTVPYIWALEVERTNTWPVISAWSYTNDGTNHKDSHFIGFGARGTSLAPLHPLAGDFLGTFDARNALNPTPVWGGSGFTVQATQNHTSGSQPTRLFFTTVSVGSTEPTTRMGLSSEGYLGIGPNALNSPQARLDVDGDIRNSGHVAIGPGAAIASPARLDVDGDIRTNGCLLANGASVGGTCPSDLRLKKDVRPFPYGLSHLLGIYPKYFKYNGLGGRAESQDFEIGVIAQDVEKAAPALVASKNMRLRPDDAEETEIKLVNYTSFVYVLINSVHDLYAMAMEEKGRNEAGVRAQAAAVDALRKETDLLRRELRALAARNAELADRLRSLEATKGGAR